MSVTPRSNARLSHTPKMSERKRALFQSERHSSLRNVDLTEAIEEDSSDSCDLGIISSLDSSSSPERYDQSVPQTPNTWRSEARRSERTIKPNPKYVNDFLKSPLNFWNYQKRNKCLLNSAPVTPQKSDAGSPLSTEKYTIGTMSVGGGKSKARKSLMTLIADTESCSSSMKDLTFDSDSGTESKENTPNKKKLRSDRKLRSFKNDSLSNYGSGPDSDGSKSKLNSSPLKTINSDCFSSPQRDRCFIALERMPSPSKILKTPRDRLTFAKDTVSPPKMHNRKGVLDVIVESPACDQDINNLKRVRDITADDNTCSPQPKQTKIEPPNPKARLSLFNDKIKQFLSAKSFYPKSSVDLNSSFTTSVSRAIRVKYPLQSKRIYSMSAHNKARKDRKRVFGEINMGVRHKIRKPKLSKINKKFNPYVPFKRTRDTPHKAPETPGFNSCQDDEMTINEAEKDKADPFETEHQTIESLLNQWTEEDVPASEPRVTFTDERARHEIRIAESLVHNSSLSQTVLYMEPLLGPTAAVAQLSPSKSSENSMDSHYDLHQMVPTAGGSNEYLPVDGGFIVVDDSITDLASEPKNLEDIEKEIKFLDDQISTMAKINNINADLLLSPTSQMCDMASGLVLTSPKIVNGVIVSGVAPAEKISYDAPSLGEEIVSACDDGGISNNGFHRSAAKAIKDDPRLFPVFTKAALRSGPVTVKAVRNDPMTPKKVSKKLKGSHSHQYIIDAGQKRIGATQCNECGVIYHIGDPQDEMDHLMHHNAVDVLRFQGWKDEFVCGVWGSARSIRIRGSGSESGVNGIRWKRVLKLLDRVVHPQLGFAAQLPENGAQAYTAYLYIDNRQIIGCLIAEIKTSGHKFLPGTVDCCSQESYPVKCGVSRLWTHISHRRRGVATHLLNSMRTNFLYGQILNIEDIAFSAPTPAGRAFATTYTDNENFLIYIN